MTLAPAKLGLTDRDYYRAVVLLSDSSALAKYPGLPDWIKESEIVLEQLASLEPGWDSYRGKPISPYHIKLSWEFIHQIAQCYPPKPHIGPVPDGGVQIEWHTKGIDLEVEFSPEDGMVFFYRDDAQIVEEVLDFNSVVIQTIQAIQKMK